MNNKLQDLLPGWLVGRKKICAYCDMTWPTLKSLHKLHELPIIYLPTGVPMALPSALDMWAILVDRAKKECP
jgi:hypothetical protein